MNQHARVLYRVSIRDTDFLLGSVFFEICLFRCQRNMVVSRNFAGGLPSREPDRWATNGQQPPQNPNDPQRTRPRENRSRTAPNALERTPSQDYGTEGQRFESSRARSGSR